MASSLSSIMKLAGKISDWRMNKNRNNVFSIFMAYRKIRADRIFDGSGFLYNHVLVLHGNRVEDVLSSGDAGGDVETVTGMLTPGLINCHCHLELSHMKGMIPEGSGLVDFVYQVVTGRN